MALRSVVILTILDVAPVALPSARIKAIPGAPLLRGLAFLVFPIIPATFPVFLGAFRLTIGYQRLEICLLRRRVHFRRYDDALARGVAARPLQTTHLVRYFREGQRVVKTG